MFLLAEITINSLTCWPSHDFIVPWIIICERKHLYHLVFFSLDTYTLSCTYQHFHLLNIKPSSTSSLTSPHYRVAASGASHLLYPLVSQSMRFPSRFYWFFTLLFSTFLQEIITICLLYCNSLSPSEIFFWPLLQPIYLTKSDSVWPFLC